MKPTYLVFVPRFLSLFAPLKMKKVNYLPLSQLLCSELFLASPVFSSSFPLL